MKWCALLLLAGGCDYVFRLDHLSAPGDGATDAPSDLAAPEACPTLDYIHAAGAPETSVYRYVPLGGLTWDLAEQDCENDSVTKITHLVVFDDAVEEARLHQFITGGGYPFWQAFTGYARNADTEGGTPFQFTSVLGEPLQVPSPIWEIGEPDNGGTGPTETITFFETSRNIADGYEAAQLTYLCECDGKPAIQTFKIR